MFQSYPRIQRIAETLPSYIRRANSPPLCHGLNRRGTEMRSAAFSPIGISESGKSKKSENSSKSPGLFGVHRIGRVRRPWIDLGRVSNPYGNARSGTDLDTLLALRHQ